jgi:uncharacterized RDD family membrane protein YckC
MIISQYGGFIRRIIAFLIDNIFLQAAALFVTIVGLIVIGIEAEQLTAWSGTLLNSYYATAVVMNFFYFTYFHGTTGQTLGKRMLGMKVVRSTGEPMRAGVAFLRWVGYLLSGLIFYLGFLWIAFDGRKQGWHDKIAGTCVIRVGPLQPEQPGLF